MNFASIDPRVVLDTKRSALLFRTRFVTYLGVMLLLLMFCVSVLAEPVGQAAKKTATDPAMRPEVQTYVYLCKAVYWDRLRKYKKAKENLEAAIKLDPDSSYLYAKLCRTLFSLKDFRGSMSACRRALVLNPKNVEAHYLAGILNLLRLDPRGRRDAIAEFKKAVELNPEHLGAQSRLASMLYEQGDYKGAAAAYEELVKIRPYDPRLRFRLGFCYSKIGEAVKGIKELEASIKINKTSLESHFHLAYLYAAQSRNEEAARECQYVLKYAPSDPNMNLLLSEVYAGMGKYDDAIARAERVLKLKKVKKVNLAEAHQRLAVAYKGKKETSLADYHFQQAIDIYKQILKDDKKKTEIHYDIALVYDAMGDHDNAIKHLREYLKSNPDDANANNFLGYVLVEANRDLQEAASLIEKAVKMQPNNGAFRDSLGWAYYKLGNTDRAIKELELAVQFIPDDSEVREHLGAAYLKRGGKVAQKALLQWEKALEIQPGNTELQKKLADLRKKLGYAQNQGSEM